MTTTDMNHALDDVHDKTREDVEMSYYAIGLIKARTKADDYKRYYVHDTMDLFRYYQSS